MITQYLADALLNHALGVDNLVSPTTVYAGLFLVIPTPTSAGVEVNASDYIRVSTTWQAAAAGAIINAADIRFPVFGNVQSTWGDIGAMGVFDAPTGGHLLFYGPLLATLIIIAGNEVTVPAGRLTLSLSLTDSGGGGSPVLTNEIDAGTSDIIWSAFIDGGTSSTSYESDNVIDGGPS